MADQDKSEDKGKPEVSLGQIYSQCNFSEALRKANEMIGKMDFSLFADPSVDISNLSSSIASYVDELHKTTLTDELLENRLDWSKSITDISANFSTLLDEKIKFWTIDLPDLTKDWKSSLETIDVTPLNESADKAAEALTGDPEKPYTEKEAEAALPKLVDFARKYDEVTEAVATLTVRTKSGGEAMMSVRLSREQIVSGLNLDHALVSGEPTLIAPPKVINQPAALPPPESPAEDLVELGSYARQFVDKADRLTHTITFRKGRQLKMSSRRTIAWQLVEYLLAEGEMKNGGWVTLPPELQDKKLAAEFRVPIPSPLGKGTMTAPYDEMTIAWHHIRKTAKSGRRKANAEPPKFCFGSTINHKTYDPVVKAYKDALAEKKRRDSQPK